MSNFPALWRSDPRPDGNNGVPREGVATQPILPASRPPGLVGDLADYIHASSIRPVAEVSLVAALGLVAGIAGRQWNTAGEASGLNLYLVLLAPTGVGKEDGTRGIGKLTSAVRKTVPLVDMFVGPTAFASGQALMKAVARQPCFYSIQGEFGLRLQRILQPNASPADMALNQALHELYSLSGKNGVKGVYAYSDEQRSTAAVQSPCVTIIGESTPAVFFECLDLTHIATGLVPRLLVCEYVGERRPRNKQAGVPPPEPLVARLAELSAAALAMQSKGEFVQVPLNPDAEALLDAFDVEVDATINAAKSNEALRMVWNRAHLHALKLATLLAVGTNHRSPMVTVADATWAVAFVRRSVGTILRKFEDGETGGSDATKAEAQVRKKVLEFLRMGPEERKKYGVPRSMWAAPAVPFAYFYRRLVAADVQPFKAKQHLLAVTLSNLTKSEVLVLLPKQQAWQEFRTRAEVYSLGQNWR
ncbi:MAG: DUF3987 domain-containing protein [Deltaproteobacteria bacterium]|nr:DUF3987 domain-containing protein [Deltaproteobacteria bacterium]